MKIKGKFRLAKNLWPICMAKLWRPDQFSSPFGRNKALPPPPLSSSARNLKLSQAARFRKKNRLKLKNEQKKGIWMFCCSKIKQRDGRSGKRQNAFSLSWHFKKKLFLFSPSRNPERLELPLRSKIARFHLLFSYGKSWRRHSPSIPCKTYDDNHPLFSSSLSLSSSLRRHGHTDTHMVSSS